MQKIIMSFTLSAILLLSGCSDKKKESKPITKQEKQNQKISKKELSTTEEDSNKSTPSIQVEKPFESAMETNNTQEGNITENLEEIQSSALETMQPKIIEELEKIPNCLEEAQTKEEAFKCAKALRQLNNEQAMAMGDLNIEESKGYDEDFIWNEETKMNMIKEIEEGTTAMEEMQSCMKASSSPEELDDCLKP